MRAITSKGLNVCCHFKVEKLKCTNYADKECVS